MPPSTENGPARPETAAKVLECGAMDAAPAPDQSNRPLFRQPWPGYWETKNRLERLTRFKNLIIHRERWGPEMETPPSLADLFPGENLQEGNFQVIQRVEQDIRQNMMLVFYDLQQCNVPTRTGRRQYDSLTQQQIKVDYDLIVDYFTLSAPEDHRKNFEAVTHRLDMGIGLYESRLRRAKRELFSPIMWLACLVRLPITVLERTGLLAHPKSQEKFLHIYAWGVQFAMFALILMVAGHYGAKIPWSDIITWIAKDFPK